MKLLRTIRFDASDTHVFAVAAAEGEWALSGAFAFGQLAPDQLAGKVRQAFANGFLGVPSLGRSTFATVSEISPAERAAIIDALVLHFIADYGAPSVEQARAAAEDEVAVIAGLCEDVAINTVFTVRRVVDPGGEIREEFRIIKPPVAGVAVHAKIWAIEQD
jgi:hypothetical protein